MHAVIEISLGKSERNYHSIMNFPCSRRLDRGPRQKRRRYTALLYLRNWILTTVCLLLRRHSRFLKIATNRTYGLRLCQPCRTTRLPSSAPFAVQCKLFEKKVRGKGTYTRTSALMSAPLQIVALRYLRINVGGSSTSVRSIDRSGTVRYAM